ncbi:PREDICTED: avidin-like [Chlamydotis macqueenii]|uniref:avidin-like n=1 Tax=Chlamydotis macqueenii TaxID=187382 RepID=UPI0005296857|nr:PREDICTED: avidin-like [Chlamydotis macqueenii]
MSRRLLSTFPLIAGAVVADCGPDRGREPGDYREPEGSAHPGGLSTWCRTLLFCQAAETPDEEKAGKAKGSDTKWWRRYEEKQPLRNGKCNLTGWWENDLGSRMHVSTVDNQGNFSGEYHTAVSSAQKPIKPSPLVGSQHLDEDGQCTFGFTVNWKKFSDSTAVFVGQCFARDNGEEVLQTSWLLREKVDSQNDDWKATRTGRNIFVRMD